MNFSCLPLFFSIIYLLPLLVDYYMYERICMFYLGVHCEIASGQIGATVLQTII